MKLRQAKKIAKRLKMQISVDTFGYLYQNFYKEPSINEAQRVLSRRYRHILNKYIYIDYNGVVHTFVSSK